MLQSMTLQELEQRLDWLENMMARETNNSTLATLNKCYQTIIDELVTRDLSEVLNENQ